MHTCCEYLNIVFDSKNKKNPKYSVRAFARDCGINSGRMSEYLSGKRLLTESMIKKIGASLNFSDNEMNFFLSLYKKDKKSFQIDQQLLKQIYHPVYFHILSLFETENFVDTPDFIAERLGISEQQAQQCLDTLEKNRLLQRNELGKRVPCYDVVRTTTQTPSEALRASHKLSLTKIVENLDNVDMSLRDMNSFTVSIDPIVLPMARKKIATFLEKLAANLESGRKKEVYELNVQLFPVSKTKRGSQ